MPQLGAIVEIIHNVVATIQACVAIVALFIGGVWGYWLFVQNRQRYPRASIGHQIIHRPIADGKLLLHVTVDISNPGSVLLSLISMQTRVQQVRPLSAKLAESIQQGLEPVKVGHTEIDWPLIDSRELKMEKNKFEIEPGEHQEIQFDFILDSEVQTVLVYSYLENQVKREREIGWDSTILYDLDT